jgi:DNA-binding transcriptional LysR family regulator
VGLKRENDPELKAENHIDLNSVVSVTYQSRTDWITMELRHLRYLVAAAEELSFRRAAERLYISHAALSQQIGDLEDELGLKLFDRSSRRIALTEVGRVFVAGAKRTLAVAQEAVAQAKEAAKGERGRLIIGSLTPVTATFLPYALARFREKFPLVEVTVLQIDNRAQVDALLNGEIQLGIGYPGPNMDTEALTATVFLRSPVCILCSENRWPNKNSHPKLADFRSDNFLAYVPGFAPDYMPIIRAICQREAGFEPQFEPVANSIDGVMSMVAAGRGIFMRPLIGPSDHPPGVNLYVLNDIQNGFEIYLIRRKCEPEPTVNNFVEILTETVASLKAGR